MPEEMLTTIDEILAVNHKGEDPPSSENDSRIVSVLDDELNYVWLKKIEKKYLEDERLFFNSLKI